MTAHTTGTEPDSSAAALEFAGAWFAIAFERFVASIGFHKPTAPNWRP